MDYISINWQDKQLIGSGTYQMVYRLSRLHVVKIGVIRTDDELEKLQLLHDYNLAPKIYHYHTAIFMTLPKYLRDELRHELFWDFYKDTVVRFTLMQYAKPVYNHCIKDNRRYDRHVAYCNKIVAELKEKAAHVGIIWDDDHKGNIGKINNRYVIIDA